MDRKQQILIALQNSLQHDQQKLKQSTKLLTQMRQQQAYCLDLMEIIDSQNVNFQLKQGALIQLKNTIKLRWSAKKVQISMQDKQTIKNHIVNAICRCDQKLSLIKLYRQVLTIIVGHQFKDWLPMDVITQKLKNGQDLSPVLHCLIAISSSFEFSITDQQREYFFKFLKFILPILKQAVQKNQIPQIIYLSIKFLWKGVHYDVDDQIKMLTLEWMPLLVNIVGMTNQQYDKNKDSQQFQDKNTPQFFYFHTKKWATRIILRFYQKHAKVNPPSYGSKKIKPNPSFTKGWYQSYGIKLADIVYHQLQISTSPKVRYFQLKCIQTLVNEKPNIITKELAQKLQYQILIPYLTLKQEDQQLANSDPTQFLNKQMQPCMNFTNLKRVATDIWVAIAQMGSKTDKKGKNYQPGLYFFQNIEYLRDRLQKGNQLQKQLSMYLICQLRMVVIKCTKIKQMMPQIIQKWIIPQFRNEIMFLRARAVDIFYQYGTFGFPLQVLRLATQGIYICLTQDQHALVRIKAASAFNCILRHKHAKQLVKPYLKDILQVYVKLLQAYDLQSLVNGLQSIVEDFNTQIEPFAYQLVKYLIKLFTKLFQKDIQQSDKTDYSGQTQLAAAGCLKTVTQIIDSPLSSTVIQSFQPLIVQICYFIFTASGIDYIQDLLVLLNSYLYKLNELGPDLWFFYQVIIYNITGIPKELWALIQNSPLSQQQKQVLKAVKGGGNIQMMEGSTLVLRNYIRKGSNVLMNNSDVFKTNLLQLLFLLVADVYKRGPGQYTGQIEMTCATSLLINFLENNITFPEPIILHIWQLAKYNIIKLKSKNMKGLNCQLLSLLIYRGGSIFISLVNNEKLIQAVIKQILDNQNKLYEQYQYQRMILGLSVLITISDRPQGLMDKFESIFKLLIKLVKKNVDLRLKQFQKSNGDTKIAVNTIDGDGDQGEDYEDQEDQQQDLQKLLQNDDQDDQDFWQQLHDQNYQSALDDVDQIKQFEESMKKIQRQQANLYSNMINLLSHQQMASLDLKIKKSSQAFLNLRSKSDS